MSKKYVDNEQEAVRKTFAGEKAKLSQMTFSEKLSYIFEYYRIHIIVAILILAAVIGIVHHFMTYVQYKFYCMVINSSEYNQSVESEIHDALGMAKHDGFSITSDLYTNETANMGGYGNRLDIYVMAGQLDFAFTDEEGVDYLVKMGAVRDIKDSAPDELLRQWTDDNLLYNMDVTDDEGKTFNADVAVDISASPIHEYFGLSDNIKYLVIADLSGSEEYMNNFYKVLEDIDADGKLDAAN